MKNNFLLEKNIIFLNHGSFGACPNPVFEDYQEWQKKMESQPVQFLQKQLYPALRESRVALGNFLGCSEDELIFFQNPTTAISNIIYNLNFKPGDEVLMSDHEYGALIKAWNAWGEKTGVKIIQQKIPVPLQSEHNFVEEFFKGVSPKTKVIFLSQITSPTALVFPIKKIINFAKDRGILTIIDGAHVPGHIELNIHELGCDFYTGALHKWLCAPKGTSFLFVKKEHQEWLKPVIYSWGEDGDDPTPSLFLKNFQWQGTRDMSAFLTIPKAIQFYNENIRERQFRCREINLKAFTRFQSVLGTDPISNGNGWLGQMVSHPLPHNVPSDIQQKLWEFHQIEIPVFEWKNYNLIRLSVQIYNDQNDIDSLMRAIHSLN